MIISTAIQDYLKAIYDLSAQGPVSTNALAGRLEVAPASVTGMLQRLAGLQPSLVEYHKHQGVRLTEAGERAALEVIRHHRLLETYLVDSLGFSWDKVHEEACRLEHVISEEFEQRIAATLGDPARDPHGDPIPSAALVMPSFPDVPLGSLRAGQSAVVRRVRTMDGELLRHLGGLGLVPGACLFVETYSTYDRNLTLRVADRRPCVVGPAVSELVLVEVNA
jgi:DtxR family Mn-dependent transcriptional regulator